MTPIQTIAPEHHPVTRQFHLSGLDGLRAVAVSLVLVFHLLPGILPGGDVGVDVFFVVSGYLITTLLLRERLATGRISLGSFWRRRARRLLPALAVLVIVCGSAALLVGGDVLVDLGRQVLGAATFSSNWLFITDGSDYFDLTSPELFRNLWSLAVEEQFYLLWPLLLIVLLVRVSPAQRATLLAAGAVASAVAMAVLVEPLGEARVYYGTDTHCFGLLIGALLASLSLWWSPRTLEWSRAARLGLTAAGTAALAGVVAIAALLPAGSPLAFRGGLFAASVLTAVAIAALLVPGSPLARVLRMPGLGWVGRRSYGLYLWHWPVLVLLMGALPTWPRPEAGGWGIGLLALGISVAAAALSYRYVEQPVRRAGIVGWLRATGSSWRRSVRSLAVGIVALVLAVTGVTGTAAAIVSDPGMTEAQALVEKGQHAIDGHAATPHVPDARLDARPSPTPPPASPVATGEELTVIGDSVSIAAAPALQAAFPGIGIDAAVSRQMSEGPAIAQRLLDQGALGRVVVIELGTNGSIAAATLDELRAIAGPDRQLVLVTGQAPRGWIDPNNQQLAAFARRYRNVELADWRQAVAPHLDVLARDQVHFGERGAALFTAEVQAAVQRLADLPPLRHGRPSG